MRQRAARIPAGAGGAIRIHCIRRFLNNIRLTGAQILADDVATKGGHRHAGDLEQAHLIFGNTHLCQRVINDHAQFGMKTHLKRIAAHENQPGKNLK